MAATVSGRGGDAAPSAQDQPVTLPLLSDEESRVLELYDRLLELQLEVALLRAYQDQAPDPQNGQDVEQDLTDAQDNLLGSRATFFLRRDAVDSVMTVKPILSAVHDRTDSSHIERDLLSVVQERDAASIAVAGSSNSLRALLEKLTAVEAEAIQATRENVQLASELLQLVEASSQRAIEPAPRNRDEITRMEGDLKASRQKWKLIKGTASAIVAGSGVDWAGDKGLRSIVLNPD